MGVSARYNGNSWLGNSAWLYDGSLTHHIGLIDAEHTRNDGFKQSDVDHMNDSGQVVGTSNRYDGSSTLGLSAWFYDGVTTKNIGFTGPDYTRGDGLKSSSVWDLNESGEVVGTSTRFAGDNGTIVWLYDGTNTVEVGLVNSEHVRPDGSRASFSAKLNEAGQVAGVSERYSPTGVELGYSSWLYSGGSTMNIGLSDAEFTRNDGFKSSAVHSMNEAGQVAGISIRFEGSSQTRGQVAWLYDGSSSVRVGLQDSDHILNGYEFSEVVALNENGRAIGTSTRLEIGQDLGESAWYFDGTSSVEIGLVGGVYTNDNGYSDSFPRLLNNAGQVTGESIRYDEFSQVIGIDSWLYDPTLGTTIPIKPIHGTNGFDFSSVQFLGEDGLVLGYYYPSPQFNLHERKAFLYSIDDGLWDLGSLVIGGLPANGWEKLSEAFYANSTGQIFGNGSVPDFGFGQMGYLLTPTVPEPSGVILALVAAIFASRIRVIRNS